MTKSAERMAWIAIAVDAADLHDLQIAKVYSYLLGAVVSCFDEAPVIPLTDDEWHGTVNAAIEDALRTEDCS